jgi:cellulose synthase (UDP-forming)
MKLFFSHLLNALRSAATTLAKPLTIFSPLVNEDYPYLTSKSSQSGSVVVTQKPEEVILHKSIYNFFEKILLNVFMLSWITLFIAFVYWWFTSTTVFTFWAFILTSLTVLWLPVISLYFIFFSSRSRKNISQVETSKMGRVAMITTKIPSEDFELIKRSLWAMKNQNYPFKYDVWLADEDPQKDTIAWCMSNGVRISSRKGNPDYHRDIHPRKAKTKEGNLAFFYDHWGYRDYDFVVQFDADHAPEPEFLTHVMEEFRDPKVGYVSSPSITDGNLESSWTVRARCYWESTNHGPIQSGAHSGFAPVMFGSHYSHRVIALRDIGGIAPEIAEDLTTTLTYNARGWKGSHALNAIAHGYGAVGVEDSMIQEYQWALVGMRAWFFVSRNLFWDLGYKVKMQFIVWHTWYPLVSFITLISCFLPLYAILSGDPIVSVKGDEFVFFYLWLNGLFTLYVLKLRAKNMFRPMFSWHLAWETMVFQILQWPWIMIGSIEGFIQGIMRVPFYKAKGKVKITDKTDGARSLTSLFILPHFIIIIANSLGVLFTSFNPVVIGYYWFSFIVIATYTFVITLALVLTMSENIYKLKKSEMRHYFLNHAMTILMVIISISLTILSSQTLISSL